MISKSVITLVVIVVVPMMTRRRRRIQAKFVSMRESVRLFNFLEPNFPTSPGGVFGPALEAQTDCSVYCPGGDRGSKLAAKEVGSPYYRKAYLSANIDLRYTWGYPML